MRSYRTIQGDTWDIIAFRLYPQLGGEKCIDSLLDANPDFIDTVIFPAGIVLNVPEIETPKVSTLPPWVD